jgi:hypothetical protein
VLILIHPDGGGVHLQRYLSESTMTAAQRCGDDRLSMSKVVECVPYNTPSFWYLLTRDLATEADRLIHLLNTLFICRDRLC